MYSDDLENLLSFPANRRKNCWAIIHDRPYTFARYNTDLFVMHCNSTSLIARKNPTSASIFPTLKPIYSQHFLIIIRFMRSAHHLPNHSTISCQKVDLPIIIIWRNGGDALDHKFKLAMHVWLVSIHMRIICVIGLSMKMWSKAPLPFRHMLRNRHKKY